MAHLMLSCFQSERAGVRGRLVGGAPGWRRGGVGAARRRAGADGAGGGGTRRGARPPLDGLRTRAARRCLHCRFFRLGQYLSSLLSSHLSHS